MRPADRQACIEMVNVAQREQHGDRTTSWQWTKSRLHPLSLELFLLDDNFGRFEVGAILFYACTDKSHLCFTAVFHRMRMRRSFNFQSMIDADQSAQDSVARGGELLTALSRRGQGGSFRCKTVSTASVLKGPTRPPPSQIFPPPMQHGTRFFL